MADNSNDYDEMYSSANQTSRRSNSLNSVITKIKEASQADRLLSTYLKDLQSKALNKKTKNVFKQGIQLRNDFWVLLGETKRFLKMDRDDAYEACTSLKHLDTAIQENDTFDEKTLSEKFESIKEIVTDKQRHKQRNALKISWETWIKHFYDMQKALIDINIKDDDSTRNLLIGLAVLLGVAGVICGVITFGVTTGLSVGLSAIVLGGAVVSEEVVFVGGAVVSLSTAYEYHESKPLIEKTFKQMNVTLEKEKQIAMTFDSWCQDIVASGDSGRRFTKKLQNVNGEFKISQEAKDHIDKLRDEFENWSSVCEKAWVAVRDVQREVASK